MIRSFTWATERKAQINTLPNMMMPLRKDQAKKLFDHLCIYALYKDNTEATIHTMEDIEKHDGMFGVDIGDYRDWQLKGLF